MDTTKHESHSAVAGQVDCQVRPHAMTPACNRCDDTGDVHGIDGEWRGICDCAAGAAIKARDYECEDCIGMKQHGCYCMAMGARQPGGPAA